MISRCQPADTPAIQNMNKSVSQSEKRSRRRGAAAVDVILHTTILVIGMIAGLATYRDQLVQYMGDSAAALHALNQSFSLSVTINGNVETFEFDDTVNDTPEVAALTDDTPDAPPAGIQFIPALGE